MKVLYLCQRTPFPPNKGEKIRTYYQIKYLLERGQQVSVFAPIESESELILLNEFAEQTGIDVTYSVLGQKHIRYLKGVFSNKPLSVSHFYSSKLQSAIDRQLEAQNYTHLVCTSSSMAEYVLRSRVFDMLSQKPRLVIDFMDLDSDKWKQYQSTVLPISPLYWVFRRESILLRKYETDIYRQFDLSIFVSNEELKQFAKMLDSTSKLAVVGNGIDIDEFTPSKDEGCPVKPVLLFTGVMDYKPNIDAVIWFCSEIWPTVESQYPGSRFIIAGMNPVPEVCNLERKKGITVTGYLDDILPCYHESHIFVAPIRIARGVQNKVLQAFSCGLPVVSTTLASSGLDLVEGKHLLVADKPKAFAECIMELVSKPHLYRKVRGEALELVTSKYTWEAVLNEFSQILEPSQSHHSVEL